MAGRKKAKTSTRRTSGSKRVVKKSMGRQDVSGRLGDYFRFSESYTSLILGIVVVIIASVLFISFLRGREFRDTTPAEQKISSAKIEPELTKEPTISEGVVSEVPTAEPTVEPTKAPTVEPTKAVQEIPTPTEKPVQSAKGTYTVKTGDDLWKIAEAVYKDGYKWTLIAKANNITNPGMIFSGNVLKIPAVESGQTVSTVEPTASSEQAITGVSYKIKPGDTLWSIAERRYKNGYRWADIAKANKLSDPNIIHSDNTLQLPN